MLCTHCIHVILPAAFGRLRRCEFVKPQATLLVALLLLQISGQPKKRLGEVELGVSTIQGIVGHELMDDVLLGASLSASVSVCTPASDCSLASVKASHCTRLTILVCIPMHLTILLAIEC